LFIDRKAAEATHNPDSKEVVLGKYYAGSSASYEAIAKDRGATYFSLDDWGKVSSDPDFKTDDHMWGINRKFLDNQIAAGKEFIFTENPLNFPNSFTMREYNYLIMNGYVLKSEGAMFRAVKK
jgi:hypothetical protein